MREEIEAGSYSVGEKLPTEAELSQSFEVSRSVVREAIAQLRSAGLVESRQGSGAFVRNAERPKAFRVDPALLLRSRQLAPVFELRIELEKSAAGLAADRRTRQQLGRMRSTLEEIEDLIEAGRWGADPDYRFHVLIAEAAHNAYLRNLLDYVTRQISASVALRRRQHPPTIALLRRVHREHRDILAAIVERDAKAARSAVGTHLLGAAARLGLVFGKE